MPIQLHYRTGAVCHHLMKIGQHLLSDLVGNWWWTHRHTEKVYKMKGYSL